MEESVMERIMRLIEEKSMKDKTFCELTGIAQSTYGNWKTRGTEPNLKYIPDIAKVLGVSVNYLLTGKEANMLEEITTEVNNRPELELLFNATKSASKKQIEQVVKMIEALKEI